MRRELSTRFAFMYRWVIPGMLTVLAVAMIFAHAWPPGTGEHYLLDISAVAFVAVLLMVLARFYDRAKRVWVEGDTLVVDNYTETARIPLADIESVSQLYLFGPERICVKYRTPNVFGTQIMFFPPLRWPRPFRHPLVTELQDSVAA